MTITPEDIDRLVDALPDTSDPNYKRIFHGDSRCADGAVRKVALFNALIDALARLNAPQPFVVWVWYGPGGERTAYTVDNFAEDVCRDCVQDLVRDHGGLAVRGKFVPDEVQP